MNASARERHMIHLAGQLSFKVDKEGDNFVLSRTVDVERPVRQTGLSLEQAEELLNTWKLRGPHGG